MKKIAILLLALTLTACSSHQLKTSAPEKVSSYGKDIKLAVTSQNAEIADKLTRYIKANLLIEGFNVVDDENTTNLNVVISSFDSGNAALRLTIGFGAGRGSLVYNAKYIKKWECVG